MKLAVPRFDKAQVLVVGDLMLGPLLAWGHLANFSRGPGASGQGGAVRGSYWWCR